MEHRPLMMGFFSFRAFHWHRTTEIKPIENTVFADADAFASDLPCHRPAVSDHPVQTRPFWTLYHCRGTAPLKILARQCHTGCVKLSAPAHTSISHHRTSHQRPQKPKRDGKAMLSSYPMLQCLHFMSNPFGSTLTF
jgi:hypothetical protein